MSDLRYDPLNDTWVAISESRTERPNEYQPNGAIVPLERCPFCLGNERETPPAIAEFGWDGQRQNLIPGSRQDWLVRVVPNRFPAFEPGSEPMGQVPVPNIPATGDPSGPGVFPYRQAVGPGSRQELIIESPRHVESYSQLTGDELAAAFAVYRDRLRAYQQLPGIQYVLLFKNCRPEAGASLAHIHSQLFGLDFVPATVEGRQQRLSRPADFPGVAAVPADSRIPAAEGRLLQQLAGFEQRVGSRVLECTDRWLAFCPFASRFAYQTWIVPQGQWGPFWEQSDAALAEVAGMIQRWVRALERLVDKPAYNVIYHNPLVGTARGSSDSGQAYVELFARIGNVAGFEWGSNCWINTISPETAAKQLREIILEGSKTHAFGDTQLQRHSGR